MTPFRLLASIWFYFCLATLVAEAGFVGMLWKRGQLTPQTAENLLAIAYDLPLREMQDKMLAKVHPDKSDMVSFNEVRNARLFASLNLDLRELAAEKGLVGLRGLDELVEREKGRYTRLKDEFDQKWTALRIDAADASLQDVRRQLESIHPKLATDQLLRILDDNQLDKSAAMHYVVTIFKSMPIDKRKKIVSEFRAGNAQRMNEILREIRRGMPQATLIREAREQLQEFRAQD